MLYYSFVLFASLVGLGVPITVLLGTATSLKIEQASVYWVTGWRPPLLQLAQAAVPGVAVLLAMHQAMTGSMLLPWIAASVAGLAANGIALHLLLGKAASRKRS